MRCHDVQDGPAELFPSRKPSVVVGILLGIGGGILGYRYKEVETWVKALGVVELAHRVRPRPSRKEVVYVVAGLGEVEGGNPYEVQQVRYANRIDDLRPATCIASSVPSTTPFT